MAATCRLCVYNLPSELNTKENRTEIFRLLNVEQYIERVDVAEKDSMVALSLTLRTPVELNTTTFSFRDRQLIVMPEISDDICVTIKREWTDILNDCKLNEIVVPGTRVVTSNHIVTLQGKEYTVAQSVERIKEAALKRMAVGSPGSAHEVEQTHGRRSPQRRLIDKSKNGAETAPCKGAEFTLSLSSGSESDGHGVRWESGQHVVVGQSGSPAVITVPGNYSTDVARLSEDPTYGENTSLTSNGYSKGTAGHVDIGLTPSDDKPSENSDIRHLKRDDSMGTMASDRFHTFTMPESHWEFIQFMDSNSAWKDKFDVACSADGKNVELCGNHEDIDRLRTFYNSSRLTRTLTMNTLPVPAGFTPSSFVEHIRYIVRANQLGVLVRMTYDEGDCQLVGRKPDVDVLRSLIAEDNSVTNHNSPVASSSPSKLSSRSTGDRELTLNVNVVNEDDNELKLHLINSDLFVTVLTGDIFSQACETIVCPCNARMEHFSGLAKIIADKAGKELLDECAQFVRHRELSVSEVFDTGCGKLSSPLTRVIYANTPTLHDFMDNDHSMLTMTFLNCMCRANQLQAVSVGIPAICSGECRIPVVLVAEAACDALIIFDGYTSHQSPTVKCLRDIKFINIDADVTRDMIRVFKERLLFRSVDRQQRKPNTHSKYVVLESLAAKNGLEIVDVPNDEDSALNAIIVQLHLRGDRRYDSHSLRKQAVDHMRTSRTYKDKFKDFMSFSLGLDKHLSQLETPRTPRDKAMLEAIATVIRKEIHVVYETGEFHIFNAKASSGQPVIIGCTKHGHYVSFFSPETAIQNYTRDKKAPAHNIPPCDDDSIKTTSCIQPTANTQCDDLNGNDVFQKAHSQTDTCSISKVAVDHPKKLSCGHVFCADCIDRSLSYQQKCPCCGQIFGELKGNQPEGGKVRISQSGIDLEGYPRCGSIVIDYEIPSGTQKSNHPNPGQPYRGARQTAYLPNNVEGREICTLLQRAFDAGLIFTIGRSTTTGQDNVVTWNDIHHKTSFMGPFGYPDPTYLSRVRDELAAKGITSASSPDTGATSNTSDGVSIQNGCADWKPTDYVTCNNCNAISSSPTNSPFAKMDAIAHRNGFKVIDVPADGDCALHAIVDQLRRQGDHDYNLSVTSLRKEAVRYMTANQQKFNWETLQKSYDGDVDDFLLRQALSGTWCNELMLRSIAEVIHRNIKIYPDNDHQPVVIESQTACRKPVTIGFISERHYVSLCAADNDDDKALESFGCPEDEHGSTCVTFKPPESSSSEDSTPETHISRLLGGTNATILLDSFRAVGDHSTRSPPADQGDHPRRSSASMKTPASRTRRVGRES